jgi:hypothetical protein
LAGASNHNYYSTGIGVLQCDQVNPSRFLRCERRPTPAEARSCTSRIEERSLHVVRQHEEPLAKYSAVA